MFSLRQGIVLAMLCFCSARLYATDSVTNSLDTISQSLQWKSLLHYKDKASTFPQDSIFFLSKTGYKSPKDELKATLESFRDSKDTKALCRYPARALFLSQFFPDIADSIKSTYCEEYEEFKLIVPLEKVFLHFAAESDMYPGSSMGHIYLALKGVAKQDIHKVFDTNRILDVKKGEKLEYSISFFANVELGVNPFYYIRAIFGNLAGVYALSPLENNTFDYIENQKRSIYEFELIVNSEQKAFLQAHLWELKDINVNYAFINHNCNDALKAVLRVANEGFYTPQTKIYETPNEYLKSLKKAKLIESPLIHSPPSKEAFVKKFGANDVLSLRDSAKITMEHTNTTHSNAMLLNFAPIYSSIKNVDNSYTEIIESSLASITAGINLADNQAFIHKIEAMHLFSVGDTFRTGNFAKYIDVSFENHILQWSETRLNPKISFGAGIGAYTQYVSVYGLILLGYEYMLKNHNVYADAMIGALARLGQVRILLNYDYFIDKHLVHGIKAYRGYNHNLSAFIGVNVYKQWDIFAKYCFYGDLNMREKFSYISVGASVNF